jgi:hypothetical protein
LVADDLLCPETKIVWLHAAQGGRAAAEGCDVVVVDVLEVDVNWRSQTAHDATVTAKSLLIGIKVVLPSHSLEFLQIPVARIEVSEFDSAIMEHA